MSNPVAIIGNYIPELADPQVIRKTFTKIEYNSQRFFTYGENEYDPTYSPTGSFNPANKGEEFFIFVPMADALATLQPSFVSDNDWVGLQRAASGFVTAVNSVMPKIIVPSKILVDNGVITPNKKLWGYYMDGVNLKDTFNWELVSFNGVSIGAGTTEAYKYCQPGGNDGTKFVSIKAKTDNASAVAGNEFIIKLDNPASPPLGSDHDWLASDSSDLVVGGAFIIMLNLMPIRGATSADTPGETGQQTTTVTLEFGEVKMVIAPSGSTEISLGNVPMPVEVNKTTVNLAEGKTKGGPPQQQHIVGKEPFVILVYPVWNGIVVASGIQDAKATVFSSSYYVPKLKAASIMMAPYSNGFDPTAPDQVEVDVGTPGDPDYVMVDFGDELTVTGKNCRFELAYLPCFFSREGWFDEWRMQSDDNPGTVTFEYNMYPIWTKNGTATDLDPVPEPTLSGTPGSIDDTHYWYTKWRLKQDAFNRTGGEIFGSILEVIETRDFPIKNGNGSFVLSWTSGSAGDPSPTGDWSDYIQSITTTVNIDNSSGSIAVDKYGIAGQHAEVIQSLGAITIEARGGYGTYPPITGGSIFKGLAMGVSDNRTAEGAQWTIPLVGLEKKLEDIALINAPFFDGEYLYLVLDFLCRYAGLEMDLTYASPMDQLGVSDDPDTVRFDWKAGTTIRAALEEVMADTLHHFVIRDGVIYFYKIDSLTGLPVSLGTNWQPSYPEYKVVMYDVSPDFEDLRNEIVVLALEQVPDGNWTRIVGLPTFIRTVTKQNVTTPDVPWAKTLVRPIPGYLDTNRADEFADKLAAASSVYELIGTTQIPGNANIRPYDTWGDFVIYGVTQNLDFRQKTWTTSLEFMRKTKP